MNSSCRFQVFWNYSTISSFRGQSVEAPPRTIPYVLYSKLQQTIFTTGVASSRLPGKVLCMSVTFRVETYPIRVSVDGLMGSICTVAILSYTDLQLNIVDTVLQYSTVSTLQTVSQPSLCNLFYSTLSTGRYPRKEGKKNHNVVCFDIALKPVSNNA